MATNDFISGSLLEWLAAVAFFAVIMTSGIVLLRRCCGPMSAISLLPLGATAGIMMYTLGINALGYVIPIRVVFWLMFGLLVAAALGLELRARLRPKAEREPFFDGLGVTRRMGITTLLLALFASVTSTLTTLRMFLYDDLAPSHVPTALMIARGRFPVEEPGLPGADFAYHYAPDLLAAATQHTTGLPLWYGYDVQIGIFALLMFPAAFALARLVGGVVMGPRGATVVAPFVAFMTVWGAPWNWVEYFRDPEVQTAFSELASNPVHSVRWLGERYLGVADISQGRTSTSIFAAMHNHSTAMGYVMMLGAFYWLVRTVQNDAPIKTRRTIAPMVLAILSFALVALSTETILAILVPGIIVYGVLETIRRRSRQPLLRTGIVLAVSAVIIKLQGGALSDRIPYVEDGPTFRFADRLGTLSTFRGDLELWNWKFLIEWLPVMTLALAAFVVLVVRARRAGDRSWKYIPPVTGLLVAAFATWLVPIVMTYVPSPVEAIRFFFPAMVLFSAVAGVSMAWIWSRRFGRWIGVALIAAVAITSINFQIQYSLMELGTVRFMGEKKRQSYPRPDFKSARPARIPYAPKKEDLEDLEFLWKQDDRTIVFSAAPNGVHPNLELSGMQLQRTYFDKRLTRFNKVASFLRYKDLKKLGVELLYIEPEIARNPYNLPIDKLAKDDRFEVVYTNGTGPDRRVIYRLRDE